MFVGATKPIFKKIDGKLMVTVSAPTQVMFYVSTPAPKGVLEQKILKNNDFFEIVRAKSLKIDMVDTFKT